MSVRVQSVVLFGALAAVGHGQFLQAKFGGFSFGSSFSKSWSFSSDQGGHIQKQSQTTEIHDGHIQKQVQSTEIFQGKDGMERKDTKIVCRDGKCGEIVQEVLQNAPIQVQKSKHFLEPAGPISRSPLQALLERVMGPRPQPQTQPQPPPTFEEMKSLVLSPPRSNIVIYPVPLHVKSIETAPETAVESLAKFRFIKLAVAFCAVMFLVALSYAFKSIAMKCRQSDVSARERVLRGLAEPLAPGNGVEPGVLAARSEKTVACDVVGVKAVVSEYLPRLYEYAQVKAAVAMYLPRVYTRATA